MNTEEIIELPISNAEVLKVLQARKEYTKISKEFKEYLEVIHAEQTKYPIDLLRKLKDIEPKILCTLSNTNDISVIDSSTDRRQIEKNISAAQITQEEFS